jgi:thioredoxin reductase (NADPH)
MNTNVIGLKGEMGLTGIVLDNEHNGTTELDLDGLFIEIGADPRVDTPKKLGVDLNDMEEIKVDKHMSTNIQGFFAAGDVTDASGNLKQTVTAAAQGAIAATTAYQDIINHPTGP